MRPDDVPASETKPAMRPCASVRDTRYSTFGPGVATSAMHARQNSSHVSRGIVQGLLHELDCHRGRFATADAKRRDAPLFALATKCADQRHDDTGARRANRM